VRARANAIGDELGWRAVLLEGLAGGRWALVTKTHHCLVDGVGSIDAGIRRACQSRGRFAIRDAPPRRSTPRAHCSSC
jgi:hypothetical protein